MRRLMGALAIVLVLTACGDDGPEDADSSSEPTTAATSESAEEGVPAADLTQTDLIPPAFPIDQIPTVDGKVITALDTSIAINAEMDREAAFAEAVFRMTDAGYGIDQINDADCEARFTGRGLTVDLLVVADGATNAGVNYTVR